MSVARPAYEALFGSNDQPAKAALIRRQILPINLATHYLHGMGVRAGSTHTGKYFNNTRHRDRIISETWIDAL